MVSKNQIPQLLKIIFKHVPPYKVGVLIEELRTLKGNKSYHDTLTALEAEYLKFDNL